MNPLRMDVLFEPFQAPFMQRALAEILLLAVPAGLLGTWVVTRRLAFATHALGHGTFPALVVATLAGWSLTGSAIVAALALAALLTVMLERPALRGGVAVAIVLSAALALGAVLVSSTADPGARANALLFGSLLGIDGRDLWIATATAALALVASVVLGRQLRAGTFARELARVDRLAIRTADLTLMALLAVVTAVAVQAVGSLLVASVLLVPAATARLVTSRLWSLQLAAIGCAAVDGVIGLWIAYRLDAPPGAAIAVVASGLFVLVAAGRAVATTRARQMAIIPN